MKPGFTEKTGLKMASMSAVAGSTKILIFFSHRPCVIIMRKVLTDSDRG